MATSPNDVRLQIIMKIREELDMEAALEEETLNLFSRFLERVQLRRSEIIRLGSQPDNPLVDHGREILERLTEADMRNAMQMLGARHELQRSMAEKEIWLGLILYITPWTIKEVLSLDLSKVTITLQAKALDSSFGIQQVSYMAEEDEASKSHALVVDEEEVPTEYALVAKSSSSSDNEVYDDSFCSKSCRKNIENLNTKISQINEELSDCETDLYNNKRDLDRPLGSQKLDKDKKGVGFNEYCVIPPPPAQVYSPHKKDLSWIGLPEFVDDTVTDYTRPTPSIDVSKSVSKELEERWKSNIPSFFEQGGSSGNVVSKPMIKFVKESSCPNATKVNNTENARKPIMKYAKMHMTGYISYLFEYEPFNGGYVSFGHCKGKITGKGSIKTDETAFLSGYARYGEAFTTVLSLDAWQDMENIAKTSAMPHEASPRVTSLGGGKGSMQHKLLELMDISTSLQRQHSLIEERVQSQDLEITQLKTRVKTLKNNKKRREGFAQKDAPNTRGGWIKMIWPMFWVLWESANILASGGLRLVFTTISLSVVTASTVVSLAVATTSGSFPTAVIFTTASVATPTTRVTRSSRGVVIESSSPIYVNIPSISKKDKEKRKMTKPEQPSKEKFLEQMSAQLARDLEAKFAQKDQIIREQDERDSEIAMIHAERELEMMTAELNRSNEIVAKYLSEYEQAEARLSHDEKVELIDELFMYKRNLAQFKKY
nr:hypothetical protein [Tanacetum cinerariifolium]